MNGKPFEGGYDSEGNWHDTARSLAAAEGVTVNAIYNRVHRGYGRPLGPKPKYRNIEYRDKTYATIREASEKNNVSRQAVAEWVRRRADKPKAATQVDDLPDLPDFD